MMTNLSSSARAFNIKGRVKTNKNCRLVLKKAPSGRHLEAFLLSSIASPSRNDYIVHLKVN